MPLESELPADPEARSWTFDEAVAGSFDDMLARSIPFYDAMREAVFDVGSRFVQRKTTILDLGCSRGEALAPFVDKFGAYNTYLGVEVSDPMIAAARARFAAWPVVEIRKADLREEYPPVQASVTLAVLTLQFVPMEHRQRVVRDAYLDLLPGGCLVVVEKVLGASAEIDRLMVDRYWAMKRANGYTADEVTRKAAALEGVLVPVTAAWNEQLLRDAGFRMVDCFWRWMNFAGWVAVKDR